MRAESARIWSEFADRREEARRKSRSASRERERSQHRGSRGPLRAPEAPTATAVVSAIRESLAEMEGAVVNDALLQNLLAKVSQPNPKVPTRIVLGPGSNKIRGDHSCAQARREASHTRVHTNPFNVVSSEDDGDDDADDEDDHAEQGEESGATDVAAVPKNLRERTLTLTRTKTKPILTRPLPLLPLRPQLPPTCPSSSCFFSTAPLP